jgi:PEP-CTERM motif
VFEAPKNKNGKRYLFGTVLGLSCLLALTPAARADTITDTTLGVSYTATSTFTPGAGNVYDVFLNVDPTSFSAGTGFLTAVEMQFKTGSDVSTSVTLVAAPGGPSAWSLEMPGGADSSGCNGNGGASGSVCFLNLTANTPVPGGPYNFEFAVTMPGSDALTATSDIKAVYNTDMNNGGKNLGITSMGITIQQSSVPEPITLSLVGGGLLAFGLLRKRLPRQ